MELIETIWVFIGLKLKEVGIILGKVVGYILVVVTGFVLACVALGGSTLGIWRWFWPVSADVKFFNLIAEESAAIGYFWAFCIPAGILGFMEIIGAFFLGAFCVIAWSSFWNTIEFLRDNWYKAQRIVLMRRRTY